MATTSTRTSHRRQAAPVRLDWSLKPRGVVSGTVQGTLALSALAIGADIADLEPLIGAGATVAGAVVSVLTSHHAQQAPSGVLYRLGCWIGAGGWLTWTMAASPGLKEAALSLLAGAGLAGGLAPLARPKKRPTAPSTREVMLSRTARAAREWQQRLADVCRVQVTVTNVIDWPTRAGYDVHVELPPTGTTADDIASQVKSLAAAARLPHGCGVEVVAGAHRGSIVLRVSTVNRLTARIPYPEDLGVGGSVYAPIGLGEFRDSTRAQVHLREASSLVIGKRGSGKTNTLDVLTAGAGRCADALVWHIDLNGGGLSQAWLAPWLEGRVERPAVDWAAKTPDEALVMVTAALAIVKDRKGSGAARKRAANTKLLPLGPDLPELFIFVDEAAEILKEGPTDDTIREVKDGLEELQRIGRNEGGNVVVSSLRGAGGMIPVNVRKLSDVRVGMFVQDKSELDFLFEYDPGIDPADLTGPGCGFLRTDDHAPRPFKAWELTPLTIEDLAVQIGQHRPDLDTRGQQIAGRGYASRYERMRAAFGSAAPSAPRTTGGDGGLPVPAAGRSLTPHRPAPVPATFEGNPFESWGGFGSPAVDDPATPAAAPNPFENWGGLPAVRAASQGDAPAPAPSTPAHPLPEIVTRVLGAFSQARDDRMHSETLADALGICTADGKGDAVALADLLRPLGITPMDKPFNRGGKPRRGYALTDVQAAAERIGRGELLAAADPSE
ncbi:hypothetical protein ACFV0L_43605 [Streptosporangium canum]|uniref:hypothetical protein n=1 Tax=Streptosporangium canum TaxID=324952 RepID=UPI0036B072C7